MSERERGSGVVLALALLAVISMVGLIALAQVQLLIAKHALQGAADLSAIAAASDPLSGCEQAAPVAIANRSAVRSCAHDGADAVIELEAPAPSLLATLLQRFGLSIQPLRAQARAGPPGT